MNMKSLVPKHDKHHLKKKNHYRVWGRDVSNALHSGTLGHGQYSRDWEIVEEDVKIYIIQLKTY